MKTTNLFDPSNGAILAIIALVLITGCDTSSTAQNDANVEDTTAPVNHEPTFVNEHSNHAQHSAPSPLAPIDIDWSTIDSGVSPANLENYHYPIAIDSNPVKAYAEHQGISLQQAQHNIVLGTASNEPLLALFDELGDNYVSHSLSEGEDIALIVNTTANVTPSHFDYVIKEDFAKGLVLPIVVTQDSVTQDVADATKAN